MNVTSGFTQSANLQQNKWYGAFYSGSCSTESKPPEDFYELSCGERYPVLNLHIYLFIPFHCRQRIQRWLWKMKIRENSMKDVSMR